jgi:hypothetical protein
MKSAAVIVTLLTLFTSAISAHSEHEAFPLRHRHARRAGHKHTHKRHHALPAVKRSGQCQFPTDCGLVPVTPNAQNAGWAMSPDQPCTPGNFCPYACPSGRSILCSISDCRASDGTVGPCCDFLRLSSQYGMFFRDGSDCSTVDYIAMQMEVYRNRSQTNHIVLRELALTLQSTKQDKMSPCVR